MIDSEQRVFSYHNLLVCDGAAVPANVGANPSLTITALAERDQPHTAGERAAAHACSGDRLLGPIGKPNPRNRQEHPMMETTHRHTPAASSHRAHPTIGVENPATGEFVGTVPMLGRERSRK